ncbi:uncharacterized protein LOC110224427 [Arabidopsis lyrata subsp. lyrata]|uniref:uncharacterized protein LOC110224427 n=1 Tax=Arabidopsis lyrata subsp. lyrata TaxID=81972 RepID=UPI000A29D41B|nr:uncharacterized protein LOC110224427 [Arabidopsis lyrata subsp. lyrata]|eukprot:XP_020866146.1 uncharacterized protein LOC110224427 [Arabidopsis lyrata subsp. lyrata]
MLDREGIKGIKGCSKVTSQQRANMKKLVEDCKERIKRAAPKPVPLPSSSRNAASSSLDYDMSYRDHVASGFDPKKRKGMGTPLEKSFKNEAREQCDGEVARMFYTGGLSFNLARNPHYQKSYTRASYLPGYVPPGYNSLRTTLLQKERKNLDMHLLPLKNTWKQKGVSVCSDGWSDPQRRPIFNLIAANESGPMMLRAINSQGETKTGEMIADLIIECIKEIGHENVVQVVTDNASNCVKAGSLISTKFPTIFWTPCVVHTLNLALKNICSPLQTTRNNEDVYEACYWIKSLSEDVIWIKNFIMNHGMRLVMFTEHCDLKLLTIASTRYYSSEWLGEETIRKAPHQDLEVTRERKNCIMRYFPDQDERREVNVEYSNFSLCLEDFGSVDAMHDRFILEPLKWWAVHGASAPKLQALAFKLLGQPSSSSCCERNWSTYKFIHSATRNKIAPQRAEDLVFVHTNLRLLSRRSSTYKDGPNHMWDVGGDQFDSLDEINLGRLEFEDLSLDEPEMESVVFANGDENEKEDDGPNL